MKPVAWAFVILLIGISFDSLLLMDNTTRYWLLVALMIMRLKVVAPRSLRSLSSG